MFCYPPTLPIHVGDNLVCDWPQFVAHHELWHRHRDKGTDPACRDTTAFAAGGGARCAIDNLHGGAGVPGNILITNNNNTRGVGNDVLAKSGGGGGLLGSIDDSATRLTAAAALTSKCTAGAHRSHIRIGPGHRRKPWCGNESLARALEELTAEGAVTIGTHVSDSIAASSLSSVIRGHDGGGAPGAGNGDCCGVVSGVLALDISYSEVRGALGEPSATDGDALKGVPDLRVHDVIMGGSGAIVSGGFLCSDILCFDVRGALGGSNPLSGFDAVSERGGGCEGHVGCGTREFGGAGDQLQISGGAFDGGESSTAGQTQSRQAQKFLAPSSESRPRAAGADSTRALGSRNSSTHARASRRATRDSRKGPPVD
jgi:hypothetical protein